MSDTADQEEHKSVLMEPVWQEFQDEAAEKNKKIKLGATKERSRVGNEGETNTAVVWLVGAIDSDQQEKSGRPEGAVCQGSGKDAVDVDDLMEAAPFERLRRDVNFKTKERTESRPTKEQVSTMLREMLKALTDEGLPALRPGEPAATYGSWTLSGPPTSRVERGKICCLRLFQG